MRMKKTFMKKKLTRCMTISVQAYIITEEITMKMVMSNT